MAEYRINRIKMTMLSIPGYGGKWEFLLSEALSLLGMNNPKKGVSFEEIYKFVESIWQKDFAPKFGGHLVLEEQLQKQLDRGLRIGVFLFQFKDGAPIYWNARTRRTDRKLWLGCRGDAAKIGELLGNVLWELSIVQVNEQLCSSSLLEFTNVSTHGFTVEAIKDYVRFSHHIRYPLNCSKDLKAQSDLLTEALRNGLTALASAGKIAVNMSADDGYTVRYRCIFPEVQERSTDEWMQTQNLPEVDTRGISENDQIIRSVVSDQNVRIMENGLCIRRIPGDGHTVRRILENGQTVRRTHENSQTDRRIPENDHIVGQIHGNIQTNTQIRENAQTVTQIFGNGQTVRGILENGQSVRQILENYQTVTRIPENGHTVRQILENGQTVTQIPKNGQTVRRIPGKDQTIRRLLEKGQTVRRIPENNRIIRTVNRDLNIRAYENRRRINKISGNSQSIQRIPGNDRNITSVDSYRNNIIIPGNYGNLQTVNIDQYTMGYPKNNQCFSRSFENAQNIRTISEDCQSIRIIAESVQDIGRISQNDQSIRIFQNDRQISRISENDGIIPRISENDHINTRTTEGTRNLINHYENYRNIGRTDDIDTYHTGNSENGQDTRFDKTDQNENVTNFLESSRTTTTDFVHDQNLSRIAESDDEVRRILENGRNMAVRYENSPNTINFERSITVAENEQIMVGFPQDNQSTELSDQIFTRFPENEDANTIIPENGQNFTVIPENERHIIRIQENYNNITENMENGNHVGENSCTDRINTRIPQNDRSFQNDLNTKISEHSDFFNPDIQEVGNSNSPNSQPQCPIHNLPEEPPLGFRLKEFYIQENNPIHKMGILKQIKPLLEMTQAYIFCNTAHTANSLAAYFRTIGMNCGSTCETSMVHNFFNTGLVRVLILTDETSRTPQPLKRVPLLFNYDFPESPDLYVQRRRLLGYPMSTLVGKETSNLMVISFVSGISIPTLSDLRRQNDIEEMFF